MHGAIAIFIFIISILAFSACGRAPAYEDRRSAAREGASAPRPSGPKLARTLLAGYAPVTGFRVGAAVLGRETETLGLDDVTMPFAIELQRAKVSLEDPAAGAVAEDEIVDIALGPDGANVEPLYVSGCQADAVAMGLSSCLAPEIHVVGVTIAVAGNALALAQGERRVFEDEVDGERHEFIVSLAGVKVNILYRAMVQQLVAAEEKPTAVNSPLSVSTETSQGEGLCDTSAVLAKARESRGKPYVTIDVKLGKRERGPNLALDGVRPETKLGLGWDILSYSSRGGETEYDKIVAEEGSMLVVSIGGKDKAAWSQAIGKVKIRFVRRDDNSFFASCVVNVPRTEPPKLSTVPN